MSMLKYELTIDKHIIIYTYNYKIRTQGRTKENLHILNPRLIKK